MTTFYNSGLDDSEVADDHHGQPCVILKTIKAARWAAEGEIPEDMYLVRFDDGVTLEVFAEELTDSFNP